jgi:thioredoxin reductase
MYDLVVLGGGPAGLTATMYAIQKRLDVLLVTRDLGGKTNFHLQLPFVERHMVINGDEVVNRFAREIEYLDFVLKMDNAEKVEKIEGGFRVTLSNSDALETRALIVATGAKGQLLEVPGEREFMMRGLCYSAVSYAQLFIDRVVVVVGGEELALRGAAELAQVARHVTLVTPGGEALNTPLGRRLQSMPHVDMLLGYEVKEVKGDVYARKLIVSGDEEDREIEVDAIFVELDLIPRSGMVSNLVDLDDKGRIMVNARNETTQPGIFAAGDVTDGYAEQVLIAIGEGAKAALSAYDYLLKLEAETAAAHD